MKKIFLRLEAILLSAVLTLGVCQVRAFGSSDLSGDTIGIHSKPAEDQAGGADTEVPVATVTGSAIQMGGIVPQVSCEDHSERVLSFAWEPVEHAVEYVVCQEENGIWEEIVRSSDSSVLVKAAAYGRVQKYKIEAFDADAALIGGSDQLEVAIPKGLGSVRTTSLSKTKVDVHWDASEGATEYRVYAKKAGEKYRLRKTVDKRYTRLQVADGGTYKFKVVPVYRSTFGAIAGTGCSVSFYNTEFVSLDHQHYTYKEMCSDIKSLHKKYNGYVTYRSIGDSMEGRKIYDVILGNPNAKRTILVVSTLHGREYVATAVCMEQLEYYLLNYNKVIDNIKLSELFQKCNIHYVMMANPDGVTISQSRNARWKGNARGVNLNRNFPYAFRLEGSVRDNSYSGPYAGSEKETEAVIDLTKKLKRTQKLAVVNYHASGSIVFGDYDGRDASLRRKISKMYSIARGTTGYGDASGYGGSSNGNYREYLIYSLKVPSITIEVGNTPCPVSQYHYQSIFEKNKLVMLREAVWLKNNM